MSDGKKSTTGKEPGKPTVPPAHVAGTPWVAVFSVEATRQIHRINKSRIVIGAVISADIRLSGAGIAPIHAVIEVNRDAGTGQTNATLYDLASESGVSVNGKKIVTQSLSSGDTIGIGPHKLKFSIEELSKAAGTSQTRQSGEQKLFYNPGEDLSPLLLESERDVEEIFDYRPASKQALEVVMSWRETILDVEHFVNSKSVTIGSTRESNFGIPPILASRKYAIVTREGAGYMLNMDGKMKGIVQMNGELRRFAEQGASQRILLGKDDFAKVSVGDVDFYISYTAAPPHLKRRRIFERDPFFMKVLLSSVLFTAALVTTLLSLTAQQDVEVEEVPERIATILYQPEKFSQPKILSLQTKSNPTEEKTTQPKPEKTKPTPKIVKVDIKPSHQDMNKPIPKELDLGKTSNKNANANKNQKQAQRAEDEGHEGKGARAHGSEGTRGNPKAQPGRDHQTAARRPSPEGGKGRGGGASQVRDEGNLDILKGVGDKIENILGNSGQRLGKGGSDLQGFGGFDTRGKGGLALSGGGPGGGGDAASLGGLSDRGRGGGRVGTGLGAAGAGSNIAGGRSRVVLRTGGPEETVIMGSIDAGAIERAILAHRDAFKLCYEREINAGSPKLAGRVTTSFVIGSAGRVTQSGVASSSLKNSNAERCIVGVIRGIEFPMPKGGGIVQVTYPFKFSPVGS